MDEKWLFWHHGSINNENSVAEIKKRTWKPWISKENGRLSKSEKDSLPTTAFAFPNSRKEPMTDAAHVRDAMARFNQVEGVTDAERDLAFSNIQRAADYFNIKMKECDWHEFGARGAKRHAHQV